MVDDQTNPCTGDLRWIEILLSSLCSVESSEVYAQVVARHAVRHGGFAPALSDEEVITIEICGEYFKHHKDCDLHDYFTAHYRHFFPRLPNRSLFVRQAANLWQVKTAIWHLLVGRSGQRTSPVQVIDTLPLPVCTYTRTARPVFQNISRLRTLCGEEAGLLWLQTWLESFSH